MLPRHPHLAYLDGWRGLAIAFVLFGHFGPDSNYGAFGVEIFFVLSGRLMAQLLFEDRLAFATFFQRRAARILPALLCFVTLVYASAKLLPNPVTYGQMGLGDYLACIFFYANYWDVYTPHHLAPIVQQIWSLSVEEHCYAFLALVAFLTRRTSRQAMLVIGGAALLMMLAGAWQAIVLGDHGHHLYWRSEIGGATLIGAAAAYLLIRLYPPRPRPWHAWISPMAFAAAIPFYFDGVPQWTHYTLSALLLMLSLLTLDIAAEPVRRALSARPVVILGLLSYSIYLWQQPFFQHQQLLTTPLALLLALACATASFLLVERPARRAINAYFAALRSTAGSAVPEASSP